MHHRFVRVGEVAGGVLHRDDLERVFGEGAQSRVAASVRAPASRDFLRSCPQGPSLPAAVSIAFSLARVGNRCFLSVQLWPEHNDLGPRIGAQFSSH